MRPATPGLDQWHGVIRPDGSAAGRSPWRRSDDPYQTWRNAVVKKIGAGQGAEDLANDLARGAEVLDLAAKIVPAGGRRNRFARPPSALRDEQRVAVRPGLPRARPRATCSGTTRCAHLVTTTRSYVIWVDRQRALFSAWYEFFPRSEGAEVGPGRDADPSTARSPPRAERLPGRGRDGLRRALPAADPPDRPDQPQGPQQHPGGPPGGRRLAVGDRLRRGRPRRDPPGTGHPARTSGRSSRRPATTASRSRWTWRCRPRPTTRGSPSTRSGSPPGPTARSRTPRTRRRSTRTSIR